MNEVNAEIEGEVWLNSVQFMIEFEYTWQGTLTTLRGQGLPYRKTGSREYEYPKNLCHSWFNGDFDKLPEKYR